MNTGKKTPPRKNAAPPTHPQADDQITLTAAGKIIRVLIVDDQLIFLDELLRLNREWLRDNNRPTIALDIETLHAKAVSETPLKDQIIARLTNSPGFDLLLIDMHLGDGNTGLDIIKDIRSTSIEVSEIDSEPPPTASDLSYPWLKLPVVLITGDPYARDKAESQAVGDLIEAVIFGKKATLTFIDFITASWPSWQRLARERLWTQLNHHLALWIANPILPHPNLASHVLFFIHQNLGITHGFVRLLPPVNFAWNNPESPQSFDLIARINGRWALPQLSIEQSPLLAQIIKEENGVFITSVSAELAGEQPALVGCSIVGNRLWYAGRVIGILTLASGPRVQPFAANDKAHLFAISNALAAICGRALTQRSNEEQFSNYSSGISSCTSEQEVCEHLANFAHRLFQSRAPADQRYKTSIRLLEHGSYKLIRQICLMSDNACAEVVEINITDNNSLYAKVVRENKPILTNKHNPEYLESARWVNHILCVPLLNEGVAVGAINLEHESESYYQNRDVRQLSILANEAGLAIARLREHSFAHSLLDWATEAESLTSPAGIWEKIYRSLFQYCGFGCLLHCIPSDHDQLWQVRSVYPNPADDKISKDSGLWTEELQTGWNDSFVNKWLNNNKQSVSFTRDATEFLPIINTNLLPYEQMADAIIPLISTPDGRLHGILLLLWFHAPSCSELDRAMFTKLGNYGGNLMQREQHQRLEQERRIELEDMATYGEVLRQFKHVYQNAYGGVQNHSEALQKTLNVEPVDHDLARMQCTRLHRAMDDLPRVEYITAYMRTPQPKVFDLAAQCAEVISRFDNRIQQLKVQCHLPTCSAMVYADPLITRLIVFMLIDNALDALANTVNPRIDFAIDTVTLHAILSISDNGCGIPPEIQSLLFHQPTTTKSIGLGSALYVAHRRANAMQGRLLFQPISPQGACFKLELPIFKETNK